MFWSWLGLAFWLAHASQAANPSSLHSVLAATALASGGFAALGATAAHADAAATPGTYSDTETISWDASGASTPTTPTINVPDTISQLSSVTMTLHGLETGDVTGLHVTLTSAAQQPLQLLADPQKLSGSASAAGSDVVFSSDPSNASADTSGPDSLSEDVGQSATGTWTLAISDDNGATGSITGWTLNFTELPIVTTPPAAQTVDSGKDATFTAAAEGMPAPTVQWQSSPNDTDWTNIQDATLPSYTVTAPTTAQDGTYYRAVFTNTVGTVNSDEAVLTVNHTAPTITTQPDNVSVVAGNTPAFSAAATGDPAATVQWESSTDGTNWNWIQGATQNSYTLDHAASLADNGTLFHAVFSNDAGDTTTAPAKLTVTGSVPSAPRHVTVTQTGPGTITIHWTAPLSGGTPGITAYSVGYSAGQSGNGEGVGPSATSDTFKGLSPGKYVVSVAAVNAAGSSAWGTAPIAVVAPTAIPTAAVSAKHVIAGTKFVLSGTGPKNSTLTIKRALPGKSFVKLTTVKTNSWGAYSIALAAVHTAQYRVVSPAGKVSNKVAVVAAYRVHLQTVRTAARAYTIRGWITPVAAGRTVHVTATVAGKLVKIATLSTSKKGQFTTHYKFAKKGPATLHITVSSGAQNGAGALNRVLTVS